jgi:hypothetical protein
MTIQLILLAIATILALLALCGVNPKERLVAAAILLVCVALLIPKAW